MSSIILYDLLGRGTPPKCFSLNTWKPRFVLNYKRLDYKTEWVDFVDIPSTLSPLPLSPREGENQKRHGGLAYTVPALRMESGNYMMDSDAICRALEDAYPSPSLRMDDPVVSKVQDGVFKVIKALMPAIMPQIGFNVVTDKSRPYFFENREKRFGKSLKQVLEEDGGEKCWKVAEEGLREVAALLKEGSEGPFFLGKEPSWADFVWASPLIFAGVADGGILKRCLGVDEVLKRQFEACKPWMEKDD